MNEVILVTGSRKGIGKALCEHFLKAQHTVIGCSRGESRIQDDHYTHFQLDVADEKAVARMVKEIYQRFKAIHVLINNAGTASMNHLITTPVSTLEQVFATNVFGTFIMTREVSKVMIKQKYGRIVNMSTVAVPLTLEGESVYAASKAAVENFTRVSARELAPFGITVNALGPTATDTDLIKHISPDKMTKLLERQPIKRVAEFRDIIHAVEFFIHKESDFITAQVLYLGGVH